MRWVSWHSRGILPEVERVVLVGGHVEPVAAISGRGHSTVELYSCAQVLDRALRSLPNHALFECPTFSLYLQLCKESQENYH